MDAPWSELKQTEIEVLRQRRKGKPRTGTLSRLRRLVTECGQDRDASAAICYHGALALLFESEQDWPNALRHRRIEIRKIRRLYALEREDPTDGYATQHYQSRDVQERLKILEDIKARSLTKK